MPKCITMWCVCLYVCFFAAKQHVQKINAFISHSVPLCWLLPSSKRMCMYVGYCRWKFRCSERTMCSQKVFFDKGTFDARVLCVSMCHGVRSSLKLSAFRIRHLREHSFNSLPFLQPISLSPYGSMHPLTIYQAVLFLVVYFVWRSMIMATIIKSFEKYFMLKYENGI